MDTYEIARQVAAKFNFDQDRLISGISSYFYSVPATIEGICGEMTRPSVLMRPVISIDEGKWMALYGDNLQDGVAGFGDSPALAMADFDRAWVEKLPQHQEVAR